MSASVQTKSGHRRTQKDAALYPIPMRCMGVATHQIVQLPLLYHNGYANVFMYYIGVQNAI